MVHESLERNGHSMTKQEYTKQVARHLQCQAAKKKEIRKQLDSHIEIALGEGRKLEEILAEMGEPEALARDFNENLNEGGKKKGTPRTLFIILTAVLAALAGAAAFLWWLLPKQRDIHGSRFFDAAQVQSCSEEIVTLFSEEDYDALDGYLSKEVRAALEQTPLSSVRQLISEDDWGKLRNIGNLYMSEISQRGISYAMVQLNASYDNVSVTFTLTFNTDMRLYGFYIK